MRTRAKVLTVATALVTTFAILPTLGAAAADTLEDGSYDVVVDEATYTIEVVDGIPVIDTIQGVEFAFEFDDESGRVLDEFDLTVAGLTYEVEIADDGTVEVSLEDDVDDDDELDDEPDDELDDESDGELDDELDDELDEDDELIGETLGDELDTAATDTHGALVSTVAHCAPAGIEAREAGLPNHGFFVSAAAGGDSIDFTVDGTTHSADFSTLEGAEEFCSLVDDLLTTDGEADTTSEDVIVTDAADEPADADAADDDTDAADDQTEEETDAEDEPAEEDETDVEDEPAAEDETDVEDDPAEEEETDEEDEQGGEANAAERSRDARDSSDDEG